MKPCYKSLISLISLVFILVIFSTSCQKISCQIDPDICYLPEPRVIESLESPFPKLELKERSQEFGRELFLGKAFAKEMDFYRAITCFKRALFLVPKSEKERRMEIEYDIYLAYYTAGKYKDAIVAFESSSLNCLSQEFIAYEDLLITLYDAYWKTDQPERACRIWNLIAQDNETVANELSLSTGIVEGDFAVISRTAECTPHQEAVSDLLCCYDFQLKSISKAKMLNAVLPGAGYYYVGQKKSAVTSFIINALFIAATYQFFDKGYIPAAIITLSLETGWYFGGINGAGIEAKQYNDCLYSRLGRDTMMNERLFPILMIQAGF